MHPAAPPFWLGIPFFGFLLSLAFGPFIFKRQWHKVEPYNISLWGGCGLLGIGGFYEYSDSINLILQTLFHEYIPFISLIFALYIVSSGIAVRTHIHATPIINTVFLLFGALLSNFIGTMGASMVLIRPYLHINRSREHFHHGVIFFIFAVSNIGGCLTPLGDPPLFLGYLYGVDFTWTLTHLFSPLVATLLPLLLISFLVDSYLFKKENIPAYSEPLSIKIDGKRNFIILPFIIGVLILTSWWDSGLVLHIHTVTVDLEDLIRDICMILIGIGAFKLMPTKVKLEQFHWAPLKEVSLVFAVIFLTMIPVSSMLKAGMDGPFKDVITLTQKSHPAFEYFWLSGFFSAFLDNAPTYLVFFKLAGEDAHKLMYEHAAVLKAISLGSVFMGAMTYIGNAPNFMVRTIATHYKIKMPSFGAYMLWSMGVLLPIFLGVSIWLFW